MKALILAAGFGTRLLPYTKHTPKPLFPIASRPILDHVIVQLLDAGCSAIIVNTHHLHDQIESFLSGRSYPVPVHTRFEPKILGTGGAIKNLADFWDHRPFIVINSDVFTDIDIRQVYDFHLNHSHPATLVLHDCNAFNNVSISADDMITAFHEAKTDDSEPSQTRLAFTGIQVVDPEILYYIPSHAFFSSIDAYRQLIQQGRGPKAFIARNHIWRDIGSPDSYRQTAYEAMAPEAFRIAFGCKPKGAIDCIQLKGDGSDRRWFRLSDEIRTLILADHGIRTSQTVCEADSFIAIGRHLLQKGVPVPRIHAFDSFSGLVFLEDLGDMDLQQCVQSHTRQDDIHQWYCRIIDLLIRMSIDAAECFDPAVTYQTSTYNKDLIIHRECRYFLDAFVRGYLGIAMEFDSIADDCNRLADEALSHAVTGFMHRDMQSRNIMVKDEQFHFIDFQGGRLGPLQYDLASLLLDPYVALPFSTQLELLEYASKQMATLKKIDKNHFQHGFFCCALTRNLQILGAFGFLSRIKGKTVFEQYIPRALESLHYYLNSPAVPDLPDLKAIVNRIEISYTNTLKSNF